MTLPVGSSQTFVEVVKEVGTGRNQAVDEAILNEVDYDLAHPRRNHSTGESEEDRALPCEHLRPYINAARQVSSLKGRTCHPLHHFGDRASLGYDERGDRILIFMHLIVLYAEWFLGLTLDGCLLAVLIEEVG